MAGPLAPRRAAAPAEPTIPKKFLRSMFNDLLGARALVDEVDKANIKAAAHPVRRIMIIFILLLIRKFCVERK